MDAALGILCLPCAPLGDWQAVCPIFGARGERPVAAFHEDSPRIHVRRSGSADEFWCSISTAVRSFQPQACRRRRRILGIRAPVFVCGPYEEVTTSAWLAPGGRDPVPSNEHAAAQSGGASTEGISIATSYVLAWTLRFKISAQSDRRGEFVHNGLELLTRSVSNPSGAAIAGGSARRRCDDTR